MKEINNTDNNIEKNNAKDFIDNKELSNNQKDIANELNKLEGDEAFDGKNASNKRELRFEDLSFDDAQKMQAENPEKYRELFDNAQDRDMAERYGISVDEYKEHMNNLERDESKSESPNIEKFDDLDNRYSDIQDRVKEFDQDYTKELSNRDIDGNSKNENETIKELGKGVSLNKDINDLKQDVDAKKEECYKTIEAYNTNGSSPITKEEYNKSVDDYRKYESMSKALSSLDSKVDGQCYAMSEKCENVPYIQMTEHYSKDADHKLEDIDKYLNGDEDKDGVCQKLEDGKTTFTDKFIYTSYDDKIGKDLSYIKEYGTDEQKEKAESLEKQFNSAGERFKELHNDTTYKADGTFNDKYEEKKHGIIIKSKTDTHTETADEKHSKLYDTAKVKEKSEISVANVTEKSSKEHYLYTGDETGKTEKSYHVDAINQRNEKSVEGYDKSGEKVYKKENKMENSLGHIDLSKKHEDKTKGEYKAEISAAKVKTETMTEHDGVKDTISSEFNVGHITAKTDYNAEKLSGSAKTEASVVDANMKIKHEENGHNFEIEANAKIMNVGAEIRAKNGIPSGEVHKKDASIGFNGSVNGSTIVSFGNDFGKESRTFSAIDFIGDDLDNKNQNPDKMSDKDVKSLKNDFSRGIKDINSSKDLIDNTFDNELKYRYDKKFEDRKLSPEGFQQKVTNELDSEES